MLHRILLIIGIQFTIGCATVPFSYEKSTTADYVGNNQYEINSIGNSNTPREVVKRSFYRKAYEVCAAKNMGFKLISKNSGIDGPVVYTTGYCSFRQCYPDYYYRNLPFDSGVIECQGEVDPELKREFELEPVDLKPQSYNNSENRVIRTNAVSLELMGRGWLYSINYDHLISARFAIGVGASYWNVNYWWGNVSASTAVIPIYGNYYFLADENRFYVSLGADLIFTNPTVNSNYVFQSSGGAGVLGIGYEYRANNGLLFRVAPYIIIGASTTITFGASIGGVF